MYPQRIISLNKFLNKPFGVLGKKKKKVEEKGKEEKQDGTVRLQWSDLKIWFQVSPECPEGAHSRFWPSVQFSVVHDKNPHKDLAKDSVFVHKNLVQQGPHRARCQHVIVGQERDNTLCQKCHCDSRKSVFLGDGNWGHAEGLQACYLWFHGQCSRFIPFDSLWEFSQQVF